MVEIVLATGAPPLPFGSVDEVGAFGSYVAHTIANPVDFGAHEGKHLLLVASPFDRSVELESMAPPLPFGEAGDGTGLRFSTLGTGVTVYSAATFGRSTTAGDTPANTYVPGKLGALTFGIDLFGGADPLSAGRAAAGVLTIQDPEGELDALLDLAWDAAPVILKRGSRETAFSTWPTVANLTAAGLLSNLRTKEVDLRDLGWQMKNADLHGQLFRGTGGPDGGPDLAGKPIPYAAGYVSNVTPALEDALLLIYRVTTSSMRDVTAVRDGGFPLAQGVDYPTYAALRAAATTGIIGGTYVTCKAAGRFALGAKPQKDVTADVEGDNDTIDGQTFPHTRGQIARRVATRLGFVRLDESTQFDFAALAVLESRQPAPVGWYWPDAISKAAALDEIMRGCLGWWFVRLDGRFAVGLVEDPAAGTPDFVLSYPASGSGEARLGEPQLSVQLPPRRATFIGYRRNYTPQQASALALGLSQTEVATYGSATLYAAAVDQWTANSYPSSPVVYVDGGYRDEVDASAEAYRQQKLWRVPRALYTLPATIDPLTGIVGHRTRIDNVNRLGWGSAKSLLCTGIDVADGPTATLKLWG